MKSFLPSFSKLFLTAVLLIISAVSLKAEYPRKFVFEEFSEVWCGPCAFVSPMISQWLEDHPNCIPVYYYSYFQIGSNKEYYSFDDYKARKTFYQVPFFPFAVINAEKAPNLDYPGFPTDTFAISAMADTMSVTSPLKMTVDFTNNQNTGNVKVTVTSDVDLENKTLFIMLVEKHHTYQQQANGLTEFHYVMRKMLPDGDGQAFSIKADSTNVYSIDYTMDYDINYDLYATALIQDPETHYIYQAESVFQETVSSVENTRNSQNDILISPNPVSDFIEISLPNNNDILKVIEIYDLSGNKVNSFSLNNQEIKSLSFKCLDKNNNRLTSGFYIVKAITAKNIFQSKFLVK